MTVKELMELLKKCDEDLEIIITSPKKGEYLPDLELIKEEQLKGILSMIEMYARKGDFQILSNDFYDLPNEVIHKLEKLGYTFGVDPQRSIYGIFWL